MAKKPNPLPPPKTVKPNPPPAPPEPVDPKVKALEDIISIARGPTPVPVPAKKMAQIVDIASKALKL